jgi:hypothetical protein
MPRWVVLRTRRAVRPNVLVIAAVVLSIFAGGIGAIDIVFRGPLLRAHRGQARMQIHLVQEALVHYDADHPAPGADGIVCPPSPEALVDERYLPEWPRDPWGHPLSFVCPGRADRNGADIASAGQDGRFGTADDIDSGAM